MNTRSLFLSAALVAFAIAGARAASPTAPAKPTPPTQPAVAASPEPESGLKAGMSPEAVKKIMGAPREIKPMTAPDGKAEIWIYRRDVGARVERVQIAAVPITVSTIGNDGQAHQQTVSEEVKYGDLYQATEETIQLLMFNDRYVTQKITRQKIKRYN